MNLKEVFTPSRTIDKTGEIRKFKDLGDLGAYAFTVGHTDKNDIRNPHYEFTKLAEMVSTNPLVCSGIYQLVDLAIPNEKVKVGSSDPKTVAFYEQWFALRPNSIQNMKLHLFTTILFGNGPLQKAKITAPNGKKILDFVEPYNDMTRFYINPDDIDGTKKYYLKVPVGMKPFMFCGKLKTPTFERITYIANFTYIQSQEYVIWLDKDEIAMLRTGWSQDNIYGRSQLASSIDAHNIFIEILSSWDTIAKTRQIDQVILTPKDMETGAALNLNKEAQQQIINTLEDESSSIKFIKFPVDFATQDIKTSGKYDLMEGVFDICRRMIMMGLVPNHLTPWADSATTQGSSEAMPPFIARIKTLQATLANFYKTHILEELRASYPFLNADAQILFDLPVLNEEGLLKNMYDLFNAGIIDKTMAIQYLDKMGLAKGVDFSTLMKMKKSSPISGDSVTTSTSEKVKK